MIAIVTLIEVLTIASGVITADLFMRYAIPWYENLYRSHIMKINEKMDWRNYK